MGVTEQVYLRSSQSTTLTKKTAEDTYHFATQNTLLRRLFPNNYRSTCIVANPIIPYLSTINIAYILHNRN
ncbi:MAG: hypothetical protein IIX59_05815 [Alistipes sp.]|nr:hypothetical protein [Alistipes sp.]